MNTQSNAMSESSVELAGVAPAAMSATAAHVLVGAT